MKKQKIEFEFIQYSAFEELNPVQIKLIQSSVQAAEKAYAPYSRFRIGTSVLLENGEILNGNNQENASYPVGICAERTLLSYVHANFPTQKKISLAITALDSDHVVSPCGLCRQTILEYETLQSQSIEILLHNRSGSVMVIPSGSSLLPLHFDRKMLT